MGDTSLCKIGSCLGNPIVTDECTANRLRGSYARILVEMDVTKDLPQSISIVDEGGLKFQKPIVYEWKPQFYCKCQKLGHNCAKTPPKQHWIPKPPDEMQASTLPSTSVGMGPVGSQSENTSQASGKKDPDGRITGM